MHFFILLGIMAALVSAEGFVQAPVPAAPQRLLLTLAGIVVVGSAACVVAGVTSFSLYRQWGSRRMVLKRFEHLQLMHTLLWLGVCAIILFGLDWAAVVRGNWRLQGAFLIDEVLIVAPVLLGQIVSWAAFYDVDRAVRRTSPVKSQRSEDALSRAGFVALHARHYFGLLLVPLLAVFAVRDLSDWTAPQAFADGTPWAMFLLVLLGVGLSFPWLLRYIWDTSPLPKGFLRDRLEAAGRSLQVSTRQILLWRTDGRIANAAVTGVIPALRYVFLSDGLLARLSDDQIVAIYKHELGHVRYRHPQLRLLALAAPLAIWQMTVWLLPNLAANLTAAVAAFSGGQWLWAIVLPIAALGLYGLTFYSWYARMMELQADLCACGVTADGHVQPTASQQQEARQFVSTLYSLTRINGQNGGGLLHPTLQRRIRFIRKAIRDPRSVTFFNARMRLIAILLVATVAAGILLPLAARIAC